MSYRIYLTPFFVSLCRDRKAFKKIARRQTPSMQALIRYLGIHNLEISLPRHLRDSSFTGTATVQSPTLNKFVEVYQEKLMSLETPIFVLNFFTGDEPIADNDCMEPTKSEVHSDAVNAYASIVGWFFERTNKHIRNGKLTGLHGDTILV